MRRRFAATVAAAVVAAVAVVHAEGEIKVTALVDGGRVYASFTSSDALNGDTLSIVKSGLLLTLTYEVALRKPAIFFDDTVAAATVAASVKFDSLTGGYQVTKVHDGKVISSKRTEEEADVRALITAFERVPLDPASPLEANADYYVRVRLHKSPKTTFSLWFFWPWGRDEASGRAAFTYIR
jgi:hypothetical protein